MTTAAGTPYPEQVDRKESRLDGALLHAWGRVAPYMLSALERKRLAHLVQRAEDEETRVGVLTDQRLREAADEVRARLLACGPTPMRSPQLLHSRERQRAGIAACGISGFSCSVAPS